MHIQITLDHNDSASTIARIMAAVAGGTTVQVGTAIQSPVAATAGAPKQDEDPLPKGDNVGAETTAEAKTEEKPKTPGRPKKTAATAKADEPKEITEADCREAIRAVAKKAGNGNEIGGIAKVEEILGQFGVEHVTKVPKERLAELHAMCMAFVEGDE